MEFSERKSLGVGHLPESKVIGRLKEELESNLPEGYHIEEAEDSQTPSKDEESELQAPVPALEVEEAWKIEDDETYFISDPNGNEVGEIGFSTQEANGVEKVNKYRFRAHDVINSSEPDQAYGRFERFAEESLESIIQSGKPERPLDEEELDRLVMLNYKGEDRSLDEAETEQFQKAVHVLEETDQAQIDTEYTDRDLFYAQEEMPSGTVFMITEDHQNLQNFTRNTELYIEDSAES